MSSINGAVGRDPQKLIGLLQVVAALATCIILIAAVAGTHWLYQGYVIKVSKLDAIRTSELIVAIESRFLKPSSHSASPLTDYLDAAALDRLDQRMDKFLSPHGILKVKVFSLNGTVVYSTDRSIIGQQNANNPNLLIALQGEPVSKLQTKESFLDIKSEQRFDVDVVETYVPIRNADGVVVGCFEIYQDTTIFRDEVANGVTMSVVVLGSVLLLVFSIAYLFLKTAVNRLLDAQEKLHDLAIRDSLTGLINRREIAIRGEQEFSRYKRLSIGSEHSPYSVMMIDLDHFKSINDNYGHVVGDQVLKQVADYLAQAVRNYSNVGRYGGEEFILVLPGGSSEDAFSIAERIRSGISTQPMGFDGGAVNVTVSIGVSLVSEDDDHFEDTVNRADRALYHAKEQGRNRVSVL
ncbi:GGDEF domain-containing protein [Pontibacterium sp.]|uniref:GGDEF domain-containing protein n=1 Tax=Pontibacterium sp. TaxID=2036026 RepID=UPI00351137F5